MAAATRSMASAGYAAGPGAYNGAMSPYSPMASTFGAGSLPYGAVAPGSPIAQNYGQNPLGRPGAANPAMRGAQPGMQMQPQGGYRGGAGGYSGQMSPFGAFPNQVPGEGHGLPGTAEVKPRIPDGANPHTYNISFTDPNQAMVRLGQLAEQQRQQNELRAREEAMMAAGAGNQNHMHAEQSAGSGGGCCVVA